MIKALLIAMVRVYRRVLSPILPPACRFTPTCSTYAIEALSRHGAWRGTWLSVRRLCRCHPFGGHGYDPVPPPPSGSREASR
jgi:putative membrane protein insertion efficiency factor